MNAPRRSIVIAGRGLGLGGGLVAFGALAFLLASTLGELRPVPRSLAEITATAESVQVLDRNLAPLNATYQNDWNVHDVVPIHEIPRFLRLAFVHAEDKRFHEHGGPDWLARASALVTNIRNLRAIRGASTITEQVVRMLNPRPRTVWTRWLEGFEAARLEAAFSKDEILEFYLNQVPYAANRRGVRQAANYYFSRDLETLSRKEMLALAVLVRSPSRLDLHRSAHASRDALLRLANAMTERGVMTAAQRDAVLGEELMLERPRLPVSAPHFVRYALSSLEGSAMDRATVVATIDSGLQQKVQALLDSRLRYLGTRGVEDGAVLVVDNATREVLVWAVGGGADETGPRSHIDAVTTPRQPGSALKPFLYASALDAGWTAAELIIDAPLSTSVGTGLHTYSNYSRRFYGPVTLRDALGNSLNIPALKTLQHVGAVNFLGKLHQLGFAGLDEHPAIYGDGIALGNGEVSLFELVQAYVTLANRGAFRPLRVLLRDDEIVTTRSVYSAETASLIANILSDPDARSLEFGRSSILSFPIQTAVKTGTSSDFRDAWIIGFNAQYTVGIWFGNLGRASTDGITGSTGPALLLRSVFTELMRGVEAQPLYLSPRLSRSAVCVPVPGETEGGCIERAEWFAPATAPLAEVAVKAATATTIRLRQPTPGLNLAIDPRLPAGSQAFEFLLDGTEVDDEIYWTVDGETHSSTAAGYLWPLSRGRHELRARVLRCGSIVAELDAVSFTVK